jgi:hypothetical protein
MAGHDGDHISGAKRQGKQIRLVGKVFEHWSNTLMRVQVKMFWERVKKASKTIKSANRAGSRAKKMSVKSSTASKQSRLALASDPGSDAERDDMESEILNN